MKVSATEFRPGNYHAGPGLDIPREGISSFKIGGICPHAITAYGIYVAVEKEIELDAIDLTEEWLWAFGFEFDDIDGSNHGFWYLPGKKFRIQGGDAYPEDDLERCFLSCDWSHQIYHVHQLQNYYFALTSEELRLKSKQ